MATRCAIADVPVPSVRDMMIVAIVGVIVGNDERYEIELYDRTYI